MSCLISAMRPTRNLFDGQLENTIIMSDGSLQDNANYSTSINFMKVNGKTFTCSKASASSEGFRIAVYDANKTFLKRLIVGRDELSATVNEPTAIYIKICVQSASIENIQVELGNKATSYIPYGTEMARSVVSVTKKILPEEYKQLDYIESTGTQGFLTGKKINQKDIFEVKFTAIKTGSFHNSTILGGTAWSGSEFKLVSTWENGGAQHKTNLIKNTTSLKEIVDGTNSEYTHTIITNPSIGITIDSNVYEVAWENTVDPRIPYLGVLGTGGEDKTKFAVPQGNNKIYYFKHFNEDGTLLTHLIPCIRLEDNVIGMYDLISKKFLSNAGTGEFIYGIENIKCAPSIKHLIQGGK